MRKVVDTNYIKMPELREYLSDPANSAVIPDFAIMETLRGRDPQSISQQVQILSEHPNQVLLLKTTHAICGLRPRRRGRGLQRRLTIVTVAVSTVIIKTSSARQAGRRAK